MRIRNLAVVVAVVAAFATPSFAQNPAGVWKANIAKSKYSPGPAPKSATISTTAEAGGGFKTINEQVPATGAPARFEITYKFDGKDNKINGTNPNADMQSYTRVDDRNWTVVSKKGGKVTLTSKVAVAADGKTRTTTQTGTDAQGRAVNNVIVYEKQ
jgi:hypothetical protein